MTRPWSVRSTGWRTRPKSLPAIPSPLPRSGRLFISATNFVPARRGVSGFTFGDDTVLTLGGNAILVIDRYVYDPDQNAGETLIQTTKGAFLFASGRIKGLKQHNITVSTPVAEIGVRGTQFWGGPLDKYGVLVLEGEITVSNEASKVQLYAAGKRTDVR